MREGGGGRERVCVGVRSCVCVHVYVSERVCG